MNTVVFFLYGVFVTYVSVRPMDSVTIGSWDKVGHLLIYCMFAVLGHRIVKARKHYVYLCVAIVVYSGLMEIAQSFVPGRSMSAYDLVANTAGVVIGAVLMMRFSSNAR